jgi:hypothetical protein
MHARYAGRRPTAKQQGATILRIPLGQTLWEKADRDGRQGTHDSNPKSCRASSHWQLVASPSRAAEHDSTLSRVIMGFLPCTDLHSSPKGCASYACAHARWYGSRPRNRDRGDQRVALVANIYVAHESHEPRLLAKNPSDEVAVDSRRATYRCQPPIREGSRKGLDFLIARRPPCKRL